MDRRTYESPMDWEYQGTGPVDVTSPFTQISRNNPKNSSKAPLLFRLSEAHGLWSELRRKGEGKEKEEEKHTERVLTWQ